jgi:hypothetical protein
MALAFASARAAVPDEPSHDGVSMRPKAPTPLTGAAAVESAIEKDVAKAIQSDIDDGAVALRAAADRVEAAARQRGRGAPTAAQLASWRQRITEAARTLFNRHLEWGISSLQERSTDPKVRLGKERSARLQAFLIRYHAQKLSEVPFLADVGLRFSLSADVLARVAPAPEPRFTEDVLGHTENERERNLSASVAHADFREKWLPLASAFAKAHWKNFPAVTDARGQTITREHVLRAIIIQESHGVHRTQRGNIVQNRNTNGSTDFGFGQINNAAHRGISVKVNEVAAQINDPAWPPARVGAILGIPRKKWDQREPLDLANPSHNLMAMVTVLGYAMEQDYPNTASPEEMLVKRLSGYNHGFYSNDYDEPWTKFVARVDPRDGNAGEVAGVHYGIQMKSYLGLTLSAQEIDWSTKMRRRGVRDLFYMHIDPNHGYAHFPLEEPRR